MITKTQEFEQVAGPFIPNVHSLAIKLIKQLPSDAEIEAISINGQTGAVVVEYRKDDGYQCIYQLMKDSND